MTTPAARSRRPAALADTDASLRLAAIDIGSNSLHMIVAQIDSDGGVTTLWRMKEPVGLGRISFPSRRLSRDAIERAVNVLARFKQSAQQRQAEKIVAVATSAVREAENGGELIRRCKRDLRIFVKVVSARDEARLIYLAVRHVLDLKKPHLIIDIGGGSVEFIVGDDTRASLLESRKLGAARMTAQFVKSDPLSKPDRKALLRHYDRELTPLVQQIRQLNPARVIGTSGTLENIADMCGGLAGGEKDEAITGVIERDRFRKVLRQLLDSDTQERSRIRGLDDQRKDQILAGALLVGELFDRLDVKRIHLCGSALREGILLDYLSRHLPDLAVRREIPDPRRRSVLDLARKCDWHKTHSEHVTRNCLRLFDDLRGLHGLGPIERELIEYASLLHDIGWHISGDGHHKHSMYLISNGGLKNFTEEEIAIIANIARYHRKRPPTREHDAYARLSPRARRVVDVGAALLRIADGLDRSHSSVVRSVSCRIGDKRIVVKLEARGDAQLELWGARRKRDWFEKVFDRKLELRIGEK